MSVIKRIIVIIIVLSLASISCQAPSIDLSSIFGPDYYEPGDELPETDMPYALVLVDPDTLPQPVPTKNETATMGNVAVGGTIEKEITTASASADDKGLAAIDDERLNVIVPIVSIDKDGLALKHTSLEYLSVGNQIMITVVDEDDDYDPVTVTVTLEDLVAAIDEKESRATAYGKDMVAGVVVILKEPASDQTVFELSVDVEQFLETLGDPIQICANGEQLRQLSAASLGLIFMDNSIISVDEEIVVIGATQDVISEGSNYLSGFSLEDALLYDYYFPGEGVVDPLLESYNLDPAGFQGYFAPVGKCHAVPDLVGRPQADAENVLNTLPLQYILTQATELGDFDAGLVEGQYPLPYSDSPLFGSGIVTLLPENPASDAQRVQLTISIGLRPRTIPNLIGMSLADAEYQLTSLGLYMVVTRSVPCLNVAEGQVSNQNPLPDTPFEAGDVVEVEECTGLPSTGDVQATLIWSTTADLDLMVEDPDGYEIYYGSTTSPSGGQLDVDANGYCDNLTTSPVENIYWDYGMAPSGYYRVYIVYSLVCENEGDVDYTVIVLVDGVTQEFSGTISPYETVDIYEFTR